MKEDEEEKEREKRRKERRREARKDRRERLSRKIRVLSSLSVDDALYFPLILCRNPA